jgi:hypothetical protein
MSEGQAYVSFQQQIKGMETKISDLLKLRDESLKNRIFTQCQKISPQDTYQLQRIKG